NQSGNEKDPEPEIALTGEDNGFHRILLKECGAERSARPGLVIGGVRIQGNRLTALTDEGAVSGAKCSCGRNYFLPVNFLRLLRPGCFLVNWRVVSGGAGDSACAEGSVSGRGLPWLYGVSERRATDGCGCRLLKSASAPVRGPVFTALTDLSRRRRNHPAP